MPIAIIVLLLIENATLSVEFIAKRVDWILGCKYQVRVDVTGIASHGTMSRGEMLLSDRTSRITESPE